MTNNVKKVKKPKAKVDKVRLWAMIVSGIVGLGLVCLIAGLIVMFMMLQDKPAVNINDFQNEESTEIYDVHGDVVAELGMTIRENVSFEDLPTSLIDAFVAVEDSRFFSHNGFDISRFTKAILENIKTMSFSQGGSTFTMQLVKNTYFVDDEAGINAPKKVSRKVQEIVMAMELEHETSKKNIFELYLNKLNFGGNRNIRGVEKAANYYFGKSVTDLNLAESALLAGVINAPYAYNPFNYLDNATARRNEVLYLMNYHGYISDAEYELASSIKVEDLLVDPNSHKGEGNGTPYQAYVDAVVGEVWELTGQDPYLNPMKIYTYMDPEVQSLMDQIQTGDIQSIIDESESISNGDLFEFPNEELEIASISVNNKTGAINGVLGGRNYADGGELLLNHATEQKKQPGSSIKPILDYALAFETLGWSTSHVVVDRPIMWPGTSILIGNAYNGYNGQMRLKDAVGVSSNTTAIQTLEEVIAKTSNEYVVEYMNSMGFDDVTTNNFNVQFAIGGSDLTVTPLQMAGAQAALMNGGQYIKPHTIERIEFKNGKNPVTPTYTPKQTITPQAAYLTTELLYSNVNGGYANMMGILREDYPVYAKTGTTDWGNSGREYGIPDGSIKDAWNVCSTSEFTIATWVGYEKASKDKPSYLDWDTYISNIQGKISDMIKIRNTEVHGVPEKVERPEGISSISHIIATFPYAATIEGMNEEYIANGLIATKDYKLVNPEEITIEEMADSVNVSLNGSNNELSVSWPEYPIPDKTKDVEENKEMDISLKRADGSVIVSAKGKKLFDYAWVFGPIRYKADVKVNGSHVKTITSSSNTHNEKIDVKPGDKVEVCAYYGYESKDMRSNSVCRGMDIADNDVRFTIPTNPNQSDVEAWAKRYGINLTVDLIATDDPNEVGKVTFKDADGNVYTSGQEITKKQSELLSWKLICEIKTMNIQISADKTTVNPGDTIHFTAKGAKNVEWISSNTSVINIASDGTATVGEVTENITVTVYAKSGSIQSDPITINVVKPEETTPPTN